MPKALPYLVTLAILGLLGAYLGKEGGILLGAGLPVLVSPLLLLAYVEELKNKPDQGRKVAPAAHVTTQMDGLRDDVQAALAAVRKLAAQNQSVQPAAAEDLKGAISTLAQELGIREKETQRLQDIIARRDLRNPLARLATIRETAEFTRRINAEGKIADKEALQQLILEIEAALADLGLEIMHIPVGTRIAELPNGSFTILTALVSESPETAGTVKESLSDAVFLKDDAGKSVFIAPAKLRVFKL